MSCSAPGPNVFPMGCKSARTCVFQLSKVRTLLPWQVFPASATFAGAALLLSLAACLFRLPIGCPWTLWTRFKPGMTRGWGYTIFAGDPIEPFDLGR